MAGASDEAFRDVARFLREEYGPRADPGVGVGADHFRVAARFWTGDELDISETYKWGWAGARVPADAQVTVRAGRSGATGEAQLPSFLVPGGFDCVIRFGGLFDYLILHGNADGALELVEGDLVAVGFAMVVDGVHMPMIPPTPAPNKDCRGGVSGAA